MKRRRRTTRPQKLIVNISTRDFLSFYKRFYKALTGEDPYHDHHIHFEDGVAVDYRDPEDDDLDFSDPEIGDTHWNHEVTVLWKSTLSVRENSEECDALSAMIDNLPTIVRRWIEQHPTTLEQRAQNLADLDKLRPEDITLLKDNFPDFKHWHTDLYRTTGLDRELQCQIELVRLINGDPEDPRHDKKAYRAYERLLQNRLKEIQRRLKPEVWPEGLKWWRDTRYLQEIRDRYTYLEPILRELNKARLDPEESKGIHEGHGIPYREGKEGQNQRLLFVKPNRTRLAGRVGCSVVTLKYYLRELTKTGLIQFHHKPHNYSYYAIGYYSKTPQGYRGYPFLKQETADRLKRFNLNK